MAKEGKGCGWFLNENVSDKQTQKFIWIFHETQTHHWSTFRPLEALIDFYEPLHIKSPSLNTQNYLLWFNIFHLKAHLSGRGLGSFHLFNMIDSITSVLSVSLISWKKSKQRYLRRLETVDAAQLSFQQDFSLFDNFKQHVCMKSPDSPQSSNNTSWCEGTWCWINLPEQ